MTQFVMTIIVDSERIVYHINSPYLAALICIQGRNYGSWGVHDPSPNVGLFLSRQLQYSGG